MILSASPHVVRVPFAGPAAAGREGITTVTLRPHCCFSGQRIPSAEQITALHERAHEACSLANSVRSEIRIEPVFWGAGGAAWEPICETIRL